MNCPIVEKELEAMGLNKEIFMKAIKMSNEIQIGQRFKTQGKHPKECIVTDIHKTYNSKGELVKTSYVAEHEFLGQLVKSHDLARATIIRGLVNSITDEN
jgi:hypothetical protein